MERAALAAQCTRLIAAYKSGELGQTQMPEDANPGFLETEREMRLAYFTLPMALNYQRDSYKLWEAARKTYEDPDTKFVFKITEVAQRPEEDLRVALLKYKLALQPNKHIHTWRTIATTVCDTWGSIGAFISSADGDFLALKQNVQFEHKKGFPYLSGPKIFNYWSFIISTYGEEKLIHREYIDIAPDTHITKCSVKLGVLTQDESETLSKDQISERWRDLLQGSGIDPIDMHAPLWFWSRNGFLVEKL